MTAKKTATRVTYRKQDMKGRDYVDARFDVLLDGKKIGEVTRDRRTQRHGYAGSRLGYDTEGTAWLCEGNALRRDGSSYRYDTYGIDYSTRMDAVVDFLRARGMTISEAREAVGKRGL